MPPYAWVAAPGAASWVVAFCCAAGCGVSGIPCECAKPARTNKPAAKAIINRVFMLAPGKHRVFDPCAWTFASAEIVVYLGSSDARVLRVCGADARDPGSGCRKREVQCAERSCRTESGVRTGSVDEFCGPPTRNNRPASTL